MKKLLIQSCAFLTIALGLTLTGCNGKTEVIVLSEPTVQVELVGTPDPTQFTVTLKPDADVAKYIYALGTEDDKATFLAGGLAGTQTVLGAEERTEEYTGLDAKTKYVLYARAYDADGEPGPLTARLIETYTSDFTVETYYITDESAGFHITNTNDYYQYAICLGAPGMKADFEDNLMEGIITYTEQFDWVENYFDLEPNTEYTFYAKGWDRSGRATKTFEINFKTYEQNSDEIPNFTWEAGESDFFEHHYIVTPNSKASRVLFYWMEPDAYDDVIYGPNNWQGKLLEMFDAWKDTADMGFTQCYYADGVLDAAPQTTDMELGVEMEVYIMAYNEKLEPTTIKRYYVNRPDFQEGLPTAKASDFTIKIENVQNHQFDYTISYTGEGTTAYYFECYYGPDFDKVYNEDGADHQQFVNNPYYFHDQFNSMKYDGVGFMYKTPSYGPQTYKDTEAKPFEKGVHYYMVVTPMNDNGPIEGGWGELVISEPFTPIPADAE